MTELTSYFILAFSSLFTLVNPIGLSPVFLCLWWIIAVQSVIDGMGAVVMEWLKSAYTQLIIIHHKYHNFGHHQEFAL